MQYVNVSFPSQSDKVHLPHSPQSSEAEYAGEHGGAACWSEPESTRGPVEQWVLNQSPCTLEPHSEHTHTYTCIYMYTHNESIYIV